MAEGTVPVPSPPGTFLLGNATDIDTELPLASMLNLADRYGEIYRLYFPGGKRAVFVNTQALVHELCDEKRFQKCIGPVLFEVRNGIHDGLFTAFNDEPNWGIAHRVLMPAFGPMSIAGMFPEMHEMATQLALKWARHGPDHTIVVPEDMTRLALDTLALCSMGFRFNSYYREDMHPFLDAMAGFLVESGTRSRRPDLAKPFYRASNKKYWDDIEVLRKTADDVVKARRENPNSGRKDLLQAMLDGVDPKTGQKLSDSSITNNLITFLIAGHETTAGLLSFSFYNLLNHPEAYRKVQEEVDRVVGKGPVMLEHTKKLPFIEAVLRETLRLSAPITGFNVEAKQDELIGGGKYAVKKGESITCLLAKSHKDPAVFGETANDFIPERMMQDKFDKLLQDYPDCWKPFGNGMRGCIGRPFAWQEVVLLMALLFQNFNFVHADPGYTLKLKQTLTIKPKDFKMRAILRDGLTPLELESRLGGGIAKSAENEVSSTHPAAKSKVTAGKGKPLNVYYGSNTGTCEVLAQRVASDAAFHGFEAAVIEPLDVAHQNLPKDRPTVIVTASYEGNPADNAALFVEWIENMKGKELENVSYSVFGCGHRDWVQTFHRIPKLVDTTMEARGANRMCPIGLADASKGDMFTVFEQWEDEVLWPALEKKYGTVESGDAESFTPSLSVEFSSPRTSNLRQDVKEAVVVENKIISAPGVPPKRHIEIQLPSDMTYRAGDYLAVLPLNPKENVARVMRRFRLAWDAHVTITSDIRTSLPTGSPIPVAAILSAYVELMQPATKRNIATLVEAAKDASSKTELQAYAADISTKRVSVLELLERFPSVALPFGTFLALLPPMRVRQYSISSSPLWNHEHATLTYSLLDTMDENSLSSDHGSTSPPTRYLGVATNYLASLAPGDRLNVSVRASHSAFHLPVEPERTPVIMIAAGTGLAPFRGFIQERAAQIAAGRKLAPALLFFGCRAPGADDLYRAELDSWQAAGAVDVRRAFSRVDLESGEAREARGCRHVDERVWVDREEVTGLWKGGARIYVCGSRDVGEAVRKVMLRMATEKRREMGEDASVEAVEKWFDGIRNERYATDVFD